MAPILVQNYEQYNGQGVVFIGLTPDGGEEKASTQDFLNRFGIEWPTAYGAQETIDAYGVSNYPTVFVVGADGKVAWNDEMDGELQQAIKESLAAASPHLPSGELSPQ